MLKFTKLFTIILVFLVSMLITGAQSENMIAYEEMITGTIDSQNYEQVYTFEGQAGDSIMIQMRSVSEDPRLDSYLFLQDAEGNELAFDDDSAGNLNSLIGPFTLEETATYTIVATRFQQENGSSEGIFDLIITDASYDEVQLNETVQIELAALDSLAFYSLTADEAGLYEVRYTLLSDEGNAELSIRNPQGEYLNGINVDSYVGSQFVLVRLEADELINILLKRFPGYSDTEEESGDESAVEVEFSIELVDAKKLDFTADGVAEIVGSLETVSSVNYHSFDMEAGQTLSVTGETPDDGDFEIYAVTPDGYSSFYGGTMYSDGSNIVHPQIATQSGEFVLVVHRNIMQDDVENDSPIAYEIALNVIETPRLEAGVAEEGIIDSPSGAYEVSYLYDGVAGETVTISLTNLDDYYQPSFSIEVAPDDEADVLPQQGFYANFNSSMAGSISYDVTLPVDGTYIIRVYDGGYEEDPQPGAFSLLIESN